MPNIYESDNFNIVSVFEVEITEDNEKVFLLKVQRLPLDQFPDLTDVFIEPSKISIDASKEEFLSAVPKVIADKLLEFDNAYTGSSAILEPTDSLTQKFTE